MLDKEKLILAYAFLQIDWLNPSKDKCLFANQGGGIFTLFFSTVLDSVKHVTNIVFALFKQIKNEKVATMYKLQ